MDRSISGDHEVFEDTDPELQDLVDWKYNGLLPLVALALSGSEVALWWLLSQLLRYSFCGICGNELEGLALVAQGQKSLFPHWPTPYHLFCYTGVATLRRDILVVARPFMTHHFYCGQECNPGMCTDTCNTDASPRGPSLGNTPGKLLCYPLGGVREKDKSKVLVVRNSKSVWDAIRSTPGAFPLCLGGRTRRTSKMPASVRDRLSPTREGKLRWKVCLHSHLEQRGMYPVERSQGCGCRFFLRSG